MLKQVLSIKPGSMSHTFLAAPGVKSLNPLLEYRWYLLDTNAQPAEVAVLCPELLQVGHLFLKTFG